MKNEGIIILSTINRTILSKFFVIEIAENIIKKIPKGTHDYKKFITPEQFKKYELLGLSLGFRHVESGPLVRSSYHAEKHIL